MNLTSKLTETMCLKEIIKQEDACIYAYGLRSLAMLSLCTFTMFLIGTLLKEIIFTISFFLSFSSLRAFFAGYHANKKITCFLLSGLLFICCVLAGKSLAVQFKPEVLNGIVLLISILMNLSEFIRYKRTQNPSKGKIIKLRQSIAVTFGLLSMLIVSQLYFSIKIFIGIFMAFICTFALYEIKSLKLLLQSKLERV